MRIMDSDNLFIVGGQPSVIMAGRTDLQGQLIKNSLDISYFHRWLSLRSGIQAISEARFPSFPDFSLKVLIERDNLFAQTVNGLEFGVGIVECFNIVQRGNEGVSILFNSDINRPV